MMGRGDDSQVQFLYAFDLDKVVPSTSLVRQLDGVLDLSSVHRELAPYYSQHRPALDRPCADDPDAARGLRVCASVGAAAVLRGAG